MRHESKVHRGKKNREPDAVLRFLRKNDERLPISDKTGAFVVTDKETYLNLSEEAMAKEFEKKGELDKTILEEARRLAEKRVEDAQPPALAKEMKSSDVLSLNPFFSVKAHKEGNSFSLYWKRKGFGNITGLSFSKFI
ncbi:hypothetical protein MTO96_041461 [Rhipicephalus appendiculatus]